MMLPVQREAVRFLRDRLAFMLRMVGFRSQCLEAQRTMTKFVLSAWDAFSWFALGYNSRDLSPLEI